MKIRKAITALVLAGSLAGCGAADVISNGFFYSRTAATDLENATGLRPQVAFEWHNGRFQSVTVTFPRVYVGKPLDELVSTVREVVVRDFKQTPDTIVLAFSLDK
jgi:hypothetical protein